MPEPSPPPVFTVFTPTYNRARTLHRVWESVKAQTMRSFEWLVVDDGSTDNTRELVENWTREADFPVRYVWQENQHKKVAFNRAVREARGELILALDSDDTCVPNALERLWWHWTQIPEVERGQYTAVTVLCMDEQGELVGDRFPGGDWIDSTGIEILHRWKVRGEKWGFQRVDVLRQHPFPEDVPGLIPEGYVWCQLDQQYKTRFVNEMLRVYHRDQGDSLITNASSNPAKNANGQVLAEFGELGLGVRWFWQDPFVLTKKAANLVRLVLHCTLGRDRLQKLWSEQPPGAQALLLAMAPVGALVWLRDRLRFG
jgi:glycosyltransferase involved in cell wall biosynthesis